MKKAVGFIVGGGHLYAESVLKSIYNQADYSEKNIGTFKGEVKWNKTIFTDPC